MANVYPLMLDVSDRRCIIVGGGEVAARKARGLREAGAARIRVIASTFKREMPEGVDRVVRAYQTGDLMGAGLVFAATDSPAVNDAVVRDAHALGILVNRADVDESLPGDFTTPACFRQGVVLMTVSTEGAPALAGTIRDELASHFRASWSEMAAAMLVIRPLLRESVSLSTERRRAAFRDLASPDALAAITSGGVSALRSWLEDRYPELK